MLRKNVRNKFIVWLLLLSVSVPVFTIATVWAGDINSEESRVISVATGTFTYDGKTYKAKSSYVRQLYGYLSKDGVDLTSEQADYAINQILSNVETGVKRGYIYEIKEEAGTNEPGYDPKENYTIAVLPDATENTEKTSSSETEASSEKITASDLTEEEKEALKKELLKDLQEK